MWLVPILKFIVDNIINITSEESSLPTNFVFLANFNVCIIPYSNMNLITLSHSLISADQRILGVNDINDDYYEISAFSISFLFRQQCSNPRFLLWSLLSNLYNSTKSHFFNPYFKKSWSAMFFRHGESVLPVLNIFNSNNLPSS